MLGVRRERGGGNLAKGTSPRSQNKTQMGINRKLSAIGEVAIYGARFKKLDPDTRMRIVERLGDKINADTLKAAIAAEKK